MTSMVTPKCQCESISFELDLKGTKATKNKASFRKTEKLVNDKQAKDL